MPTSSPIAIRAIESTRTFEAAIQNILEAIEGARLGAGDRLPNEGEMAAQLGISKPTLRQALRVLERAGVLDVRRGVSGGIFVTIDLIPVELIGDYVAVEEDQVVDVLLARRAIETAATRLAALRATEEDFTAIDRTVELLAKHIGERPLVMRADAAFHRVVTRACHNSSLQEAMRSVGRAVAPIRDAYRGGVEFDELTLDIHRRQLAAMRAQDLAGLDTILDEHFRVLEESFAVGIGSDWQTLFAPLIASARP